MKPKDLYYHADEILGPGKAVQIELRSERESDIMIMVLARWKFKHPNIHIRIDLTNNGEHNANLEKR